MRKLWLILLVLSALTSCKGVEIPNIAVCTVAGRLRAGALCAESLSYKTYNLSYEGYLRMLEPAAATKSTPARAGAMCMTAMDFGKMKTALQQACVALKKRCTYELQAALQRVDQQQQFLSGRR